MNAGEGKSINKASKCKTATREGPKQGLKSVDFARLFGISSRSKTVGRGFKSYCPCQKIQVKSRLGFFHLCSQDTTSFAWLHATSFSRWLTSFRRSRHKWTRLHFVQMMCFAMKWAYAQWCCATCKLIRLRRDLVRKHLKYPRICGIIVQRKVVIGVEAAFNDIDALVLSVIYQNNQIDLVKWIGMIDFYERIILTFDELNTSLEKLQKCGFIKFSNGEFILLTEIENLFPKSFKIRNCEKIYNKLAKKKCIEVMESRFVLSEAEYTEAVNRYRKTAKSSHI